MRRPLSFAVLGSTGIALAIALCCGCSSSYRSEDLTTADLLFRNNDLQNYLDTRRAYLREAQDRLATLDDQALEALGRLNRIRRDADRAAANASASATELSQLRGEIAGQVRRREELRRKLRDAETALRTRRADASLARTNLEADRASVKELEATITTLEAENQELDTAIERVLKLREEQLLRQQAAESGSTP